MVVVDITNALTYTGNLNIDNFISVGNVYSGIDIGSMAPGSSKSITFTATIQSNNLQSFQVNARANAQNASDSDYLLINVPQSAQNTGPEKINH